MVFAVMVLVPSLAVAGTDYRELLLKAMDAKDGTVTEEVSGRSADMIRRQIGRPDARVVAEVTTVAELEPGWCKRFQIRFTTPGTQLKLVDGSEKMLDVSMQLNMCRNGQPPDSGSSVEN